MKRHNITIIGLLAYSALISGLFIQSMTADDDNNSLVYDIVISGVVRDVQRLPDGNDLVTMEAMWVNEVNGGYLKGVSIRDGDFVEVLSLRQDRKCSMDFELGWYVIHAQANDGELSTNWCWGTHPFKRSAMQTRDDTVYSVPFDTP